MILIDGRKAREHYLHILQERIKKLSFTPVLAIIQVGGREDSNAFIKAKKSFANKIGAKEIHVQFDEKVGKDEILKTVDQFNKDKNINGIIVQLPLPNHLNQDEIINTIDPRKDVDGLTPNTLFMPATARGISQLLSFYDILIKDKKVTVMGRSKLVGTPIANMCRKGGALVTVCHSGSENIPNKAKDSDILIVAIGKPNHVDSNFVSENQIVIDVGITRVGEKLVGDVDFEKVKGIVKMITPVPGGVGVMTVLALFENLVDSCYIANY